MTFFALLDEKHIALPNGNKILKAKDYTELVEAQRLIEKLKADEVIYKDKAIKRGEKKGIKEGLKKFNDALAFLEEERMKIRSEMETALVPLALAAVKKIIGKEIDAKNASVADIIATSLKGISHHKKVKIYVNKTDLENVEEQKPRLKELFENLQSFSIATRDDVPQDGCIIETEAGILHVSLDQQLVALEKAFKAFLQPEKAP